MPAPLKLPFAMALAFGLLALTGLVWTPLAPGLAARLTPVSADPAAMPAARPGFVLGTVILLPLLVSIWTALRLLPRIRRMDSAGLLAIFAISAAATLGWFLTGPPGSPDLSYLLALLASWFLLINRSA